MPSMILPIRLPRDFCLMFCLLISYLFSHCLISGGPCAPLTLARLQLAVGEGQPSDPDECPSPQNFLADCGGGGSWRRFLCQCQRRIHYRKRYCVYNLIAYLHFGINNRYTKVYTRVFIRLSLSSAGFMTDVS